MCPAYGKTCEDCGRKNHFKRSQRCPKRSNVHQISEFVPDSDDSCDEWIQAIETSDDTNVSKCDHSDIRCKMLIGDEVVVFQSDSGSSVSTLPERYATKITPTRKKLCMWNGTKYTAKGMCRRNIMNPETGKKYSVEFVVCEGEFTPLLSHRVSQIMGLYSVNEENFDRVSKVMSEKQSVVDNYPNVFSSDYVGSLPGMHTLKIDSDAQPVIMPAHRVPIAVRKPLKEKLDRLVANNVPSPVEQPTPWVNQMVTVTKPNGDIRLCLDPKELNKVLLREHYTIPILDDVIHEVSCAKVFPKADVSDAYWHVKLDEESSLLTTFQTPFGRYRWNVLPFGLCVSSEIFQRKLQETLSDLPGIIIVADDITIYGETEEEHDKNLKALLQKCQSVGIKLNPQKLELKSESVSFLGHLITKEGLKVDPTKVQSITRWSRPTVWRN